MQASFVPLPLAAAGGGGGILTIDWTLMWGTVVVFGIFAWLMGKFAWGTLLKVIDEREQSIRDDVASAEKAAAEAINRALVDVAEQEKVGAGV